MVQKALIKFFKHQQPIKRKRSWAHIKLQPSRENKINFYASTRADYASEQWNCLQTEMNRAKQTLKVQGWYRALQYSISRQKFSA